MPNKSLFGNDPDSIECPKCRGCCGRLWKDMPQIIYGKIYVPRTGDTSCFEMTKDPIVDIDLCNICGANIPLGVGWSSKPVKIIDDGTTNPNSSDEVCCAQMSLFATCKSGDFSENGDCTWSWYISWSGGESLTFGLTNVTPTSSESRKLSGCNPIAGTWQLMGPGEAAACVLAGDPGNYAQVTLSETDFGCGYSNCRWACCNNEQNVYYATVVSSCAKLHDKVIPLHRVGSFWQGSITNGGCCPEDLCGNITIAFFQSTWSVDDTECGAVLNVTVANCNIVSSISVSFGDSKCPPYTFSGTITGCSSCCPDGSTISVTISA